MNERLNVNEIKREAKKYGKRNKVDKDVALDALAREHGFANWLELREEHRRQIAEDAENQPPMDENAHLPFWERKK
jgi:hypothetical protein